MTNVHFHRCDAHNIILAHREACPRCVSAAREKALAAAVAKDQTIRATLVHLDGAGTISQHGVASSDSLGRDLRRLVELGWVELGRERNGWRDVVLTDAGRAALPPEPPPEQAQKAGEHVCWESGTPPCEECFNTHKCFCNAVRMPPCAYCTSGVDEEWCDG